MSEDRLLSDEELAEKLATLIVAFNMTHTEKGKEDIDKIKGKYMMPAMLNVINTQKRLYADEAAISLLTSLVMWWASSDAVPSSKATIEDKGKDKPASCRAESENNQ